MHMSNLNGYIAICKGQRLEFRAVNLWDAVQHARKALKVGKKDQGLLSVTLAEWPNGSPVIHSTASI
jgi:hypothetical protein